MPTSKRCVDDRISHANIQVHQILVDGGNSADVLALQTIHAMSIGRERLRVCTTPLMGFDGE